MPRILLGVILFSALCSLSGCSDKLTNNKQGTTNKSSQSRADANGEESDNGNALPNASAENAGQLIKDVKRSTNNITSLNNSAAGLNSDIDL